MIKMDLFDGTYSVTIECKLETAGATNIVKVGGAVDMAYRSSVPSKYFDIIGYKEDEMVVKSCEALELRRLSFLIQALVFGLSPQVAMLTMTNIDWYV